MSTFRAFVASLPAAVQAHPDGHPTLYERYQRNEQMAFNIATRREELAALLWEIIDLLHAHGLDLNDLRAIARCEAGLPVFPLSEPDYLLPPGHQRGF